MNKLKYFHACIFLYFGLFLATYFIWLFQGMVLTVTAFIGVLWALLFSAVLLWLLERLIYYTKWSEQTDPARQLPQRLVHKMQSQDSYAYARRTLYIYSNSNKALLAAVLLWAGWGLWSSSNPPEPASLSQLNTMIFNVFQSYNLAIKAGNYNFYSLFDVACVKILPVCLIAFSYIFAQIVGYSSRIATLATGVIAGLFAICFCMLLLFLERASGFTINDDVWSGYGWGRSNIMQALHIIQKSGLSPLQIRFIETGLPGVLFAYIPPLIVFFVLARNCFGHPDMRYKSAAGFGILLALLYADLSLVYSDLHLCLWLSGWTLLAFLSIRGRKDARKIYRIYQ